MHTITSSVFINRPPQVVFDFITNPANAHMYQRETESAEWTSNGPPGVGSTWKVVTNFLGRKIEADVEITGWDPPKMVRYKTTSGPIPFENVTTLESQGEGTLMTDMSKAEFGGFFKLAEGMVGKQMEKVLDAGHAALKEILESGTG